MCMRAHIRHNSEVLLRNLGFSQLDVRYVIKLAVFALLEDEVFILEFNRARGHPYVLLNRLVLLLPYFRKMAKLACDIKVLSMRIRLNYTFFYVDEVCDRASYLQERGLRLSIYLLVFFVGWCDQAFNVIVVAMAALAALTELCIRRVLLDCYSTAWRL